jgi:hypothetical protein
LDGDANLGKVRRGDVNGKSRLNDRQVGDGTNIAGTTEIVFMKMGR